MGYLHGIPYGLKDLFAVKGYKTTWGTTPYKDQVIDIDSYVYQQLKKAGAVLCAKLSMGALAYNNKWFGGETKNPWNLKQGSSGSSAGSAAAAAAGLLAIYDWHRNIRFDRISIHPMRCNRTETNIWNCQPLWRDGTLLESWIKPAPSAEAPKMLPLFMHSFMEQMGKIPAPSGIHLIIPENWI